MHHSICGCFYQVRANMYSLERPPIGVHSISMVQTHYLDRPDRSG